MSRTYELLREAEACVQDTSHHQNGFENIEKCLEELQLSYNQVLTQNFDALHNSYILINTIIADPYKYMSLQEENQEPFDAALSEFLEQRRFQIFERIDKILKHHVFTKINELTSKIEDEKIRVEINQRLKQLEFLEYKKRTKSMSCSVYEQILEELGESQTTDNQHSKSHADPSNSPHAKNHSARLIISQMLQKLRRN